MDLHSALRVLLRRWYIVVAGLVLTAGGIAVAISATSHTYEAKGEVVLLAAPAPPAPTEAQPNPPGAHNPYAVMDLPDVVDIVSASVNSEASANELTREGVTGPYAVTGNLDFQRGPIMDVSVTAGSAREALAQWPILTRRIATSLHDLQIAAGANPDYLVTSQRISAPQVQQASVLAKLRSGIIVLVVGVILTLALAFGVDALLRARKRRRSALELDRREEKRPAVAAGERGGKDPAPAGGTREREPAPVAVATKAEESGTARVANGARTRAASQRNGGNGSGVRTTSRPPKAESSADQPSAP